MPDIGANQMYYNAKESGPISTMPDIPGLAVWHEGHIGVYIGGGQVIEARLLELCKAFGVQTENTHSQSGCGYDQIRLYELTLSCRSLQTVAASSICKTPTLRG